MTDACVICGDKKDFVNKHPHAVRKMYCNKCAAIVYYDRRHKHRKHGKILTCRVCGAALLRYHVKYCSMKCLLIDYYRHRIDWALDKKIRRHMEKLAEAQSRDLLKSIKKSAKRRYYNEVQN